MYTYDIARSLSNKPMSYTQSLRNMDGVENQFMRSAIFQEENV